MRISETQQTVCYLKYKINENTLRRHTKFAVFLFLRDYRFDQNLKSTAENTNSEIISLYNLRRLYQNIP